MSLRSQPLQRSSVASRLALGLALAALVTVGGLISFGASQRGVDAGNLTRTTRKLPVGAASLGALISDELAATPRFARWVEVEDFPSGIAQFRTVFWEPEDTQSLRKLIRETDLVHGKRVLEIGTGTGLVALCCLANRAEHVVATDINPHAVANARYNAARFPVTAGLQTRLVSETAPGAFAVVGDDERFDLIISNPPWEDRKPAIVDEFALYDPEFALLESLLAGLESHLRPGGRVLLAYGCVEAIRVLQLRAPDYGWQVDLIDSRDLDELPNLFLPGMLLELKRSDSTVPVSDTMKK